MVSVLEVTASTGNGEVGLVFPDIQEQEDEEEYEEDNTSNFWWWNYWQPYLP